MSRDNQFDFFEYANLQTLLRLAPHSVLHSPSINNSVIINVASASSETVIIESSLEQAVTSPGETVVITCTTRGTHILEWISDQYIGAGRLQITSFPHDPDRVDSTDNRATFASRVNVTTENEEMVIVSQLHIVASAQYPDSSVTCRNNGHQSSKDVSFQVIAIGKLVHVCHSVLPCYIFVDE